MRLSSSTCYLLCGIILISAAIVGLLMSCDEKEIDPPVVGPGAGAGPVGGGDAQQLTLQANPSDTIDVPQGSQGSFEVTARVENNIGQPMPDGTSVQWTTTIGSVDKSTDSTTDGFSTVTLTFPTDYTGCSTVTARSGDVSGQIYLCVNRVEFTPTPTPTVTPTPTATATATSTPSNTDPTIVTNAPITVTNSSTGNVINAGILETTDAEQGASDLIYTLTSLPADGLLYNGGTALNTVGDNFTQQDINDGNITYDAGAAGNYSFDFTVRDGAGGSVTGTFNITVN